MIIIILSYNGMWRSLVSALALGARGRGFESLHPDHIGSWKLEVGGWIKKKFGKSNFHIKKYGPLAQLVEQATLNRQVTGSIPVWPTKKTSNGKGSEGGSPCHCL